MSIDESDFRDEVRRALAEPAVRDALAAVRTSADREPDVRPLYRELGRRGLLAVSWPVAYGGRGARHADAAAVVEELVRAGMPDMLHVLSVQIVGLFLLQAGSPEQKARHLPTLAAGERFATVLYTEPEVGSDLAALSSRAVRDGDGYRITGVKVYGLKSGMSDLGLCAVRTGTGRTKYDGISLFLVDLAADGVRRGHIASFADEQFDRVELDEVRVGRDALLGAEGEGWSLLTRCLAIERTGLDYALKAERWYGAALAGIAPDSSDRGLLADAGWHGAAVTAARLLAWDVIRRLDESAAPLDPSFAAMAKYHTSETAQQTAVWAALTHGVGYRFHGLSEVDAAVLEAGYREAPGLTLSAGTSEIMLDLVASSTLDRADPPADPVLDRLAGTVRSRLDAAVGDPHDALRDLDALGFEAPVAAGGFELGVACGVAVSAELGRTALPDVYSAGMLVVDAAVAGDDLKTAATVCAGDLRAVAAGLDATAGLDTVDGVDRSGGTARRPVAVRTDGGWALTGVVAVEPSTPSAACCVVVPAEGEVRLALLPPEMWRPRVTVNRLGHSWLALDGLVVPENDLVGTFGSGRPLSDPDGLLARARVRHGGYLYGLGLGSYQLAVEHARSRRQFDRPIVANQAVGFDLARARIALAATRRLLDDAARLADTADPGGDRRLAAVQALAAAADTATRVVRLAVQVHGARGMSLEYPVHRFYLALREAAGRLGPPGVLWQQAGALRLAAATSAPSPPER
jgi:alkylation response protein AidB-like acyl-CoA dehydrogenase